MTNVTISVKHVKSNSDQPCGVCGAMFVPAEDSGSRVISLSGFGSEPVASVLCGGCYSKWSHGTSVTLRHAFAG
jgi:hypothetical protein